MASRRPRELSEAEFEAWRSARQGRRRTELPPPAFVQLDGFVSGDAKRLNALLARHVGVPLDVAAVEQDIAIVGGLDRYQTVTWRMMRDPARGFGLQVQGRVKPYAPPFMMLGINLENTTSKDFRTRRVRRVGKRPLENQRQRRGRHGYARRPGRHRRLVGFRRALAHLLRCRTDVPLTLLLTLIAPATFQASAVNVAVVTADMGFQSIAVLLEAANSSIFRAVGQRRGIECVSPPGHDRCDVRQERRRDGRSIA
jgi:hypothetical protein